MPPKTILPLVLLCCLAVSSPADAASCAGDVGPAATLLFPYFEVDLDEPRKRTTLISIGNASDEVIVARAVVWSNCGLPVLDFTLFLPGNAVQPVDLGRVLVDGKLPAYGLAGILPFPGCALDLDRLPLDAAAREAVQARLLGQPDPQEGLCYAVPPSTPRRLVGFVTVDVLNECSPNIRTPRDDGYFASGGTGVASNANLLWGDFYFVDGAANAAQGFTAVPVVADPAAFADGPGPSFYSRPGDDRPQLGKRYRTRFFNGGGFDGGTEIIVWTFEHFNEEPFECGLACDVLRWGFSAVVRDERGAVVGNTNFYSPHSLFKLAAGGPDLPVGVRFGTLDLSLFVNCGICSPPAYPIQGWVLQIHKATGRFSVGLDATPLDDGCDR